MIDMLSRGEILVQPDPKKKTPESGDEMTDAIPIAPSSKLLANRAKIAASLKSQSYASSYGSGSDVTANSFRTSGGARNQPLNSKSKPQNRSFDLDLGGAGAQVPSKIEVEPEKNFFRKNSSDVQPPVQPKAADLNPFGDDPEDDSTNPFGDDDDDDVMTTSQPPKKTQPSNPFGDEVESSNPFGEPESEPTNPFGEPDSEPANPFGEPEDEEFDASNPFA